MISVFPKQILSGFGVKSPRLPLILGGSTVPVGRGAGGKQGMVQPGLHSARAVCKTSLLWNIFTLSAGISN